jgi:antiviral helicase SKI2
LYKICDDSRFLPQGVKEARDAFNKKNAPKVGSGAGPGGSGALGKVTPGQKNSGQSGTGFIPQRGGNGGWKSETSQWYSLVKYLSKRSLLPVSLCNSLQMIDKLASFVCPFLQYPSCEVACVYN